MNNMCTDPKIGNRLHAYELGALPEPEMELFEKHLMTCDYCFNEARRFSDYGTLLRKGSLVGQELEAAGGGALSTEPWLARIRRYVWPSTPLVFRPAVLMLIVLLLIYPAYRGLRPAGQQDIRPVVGIMLYPSRSAEDVVQRFRADSDLVLSFVCEEARPGQPYSVSLINENGETLWRSDDFMDFDIYGLGHVMLPGNRLKAGKYKLIIDSTDKSQLTSPHEYSFYLLN